MPTNFCFLSSLLGVISSFLSSHNFKLPCLQSLFAMNPFLSSDSSSTESDIFYVECSLEDGSPVRTKTLAVLNSTQLSRAMASETNTISSVAPLALQIAAIDSDSNEPTFPYGFGNHYPIVPPSLKDLNLPPNPFNVLATRTVTRPDEGDSPQSPEQSEPSQFSAPP